jgi:hypothetical protein
MLRREHRIVHHRTGTGFVLLAGAGSGRAAQSPVPDA